MLRGSGQPITAPEETIAVENVVASTGIDQELDLATLAEDLHMRKYDPDQFPELVYRLDSQPVVLLLSKRRRPSKS